jgi:hypothetical protein
MRKPNAKTLTNKQVYSYNNYLRELYRIYKLRNTGKPFSGGFCVLNPSSNSGGMSGNN